MRTEEECDKSGDPLILARSSVGGRLPYNNPDSNRITLHRVKDFRTHALNLRPKFPPTSK